MSKFLKAAGFEKPKEPEPIKETKKEVAYNSKEYWDQKDKERIERDLRIQKLHDETVESNKNLLEGIKELTASIEAFNGNFDNSLKLQSTHNEDILNTLNTLYGFLRTDILNAVDVLKKPATKKKTKKTTKKSE